MQKYFRPGPETLVRLAERAVGGWKVKRSLPGSLHPGERTFGAGRAVFGPEERNLRAGEEGGGIVFKNVRGEERVASGASRRSQGHKAR